MSRRNTRPALSMEPDVTDNIFAVLDPSGRALPPVRLVVAAAILTLRLSANTVTVRWRAKAIKVMIAAIFLRAGHRSHRYSDHHPQTLAADLEPRSRI
jgi:hypothetical protein